MKNIFLILLLPYLSVGQSLTENFVKQTIYKIPIATSYEAYSTPSINKTETVIYYDGLGRPIQQVAHAQSNTGKDIVTHIEYDAFGRMQKEFLPFIATGTASLNIKSNEVASFYGSNNANLTGNPNFEVTQFPYSQKQFEASPLNRVQKQAAPGDAWSLGSGKEIKFDYQTNTANDVKLYRVTTTWNATLGVYDIALSLTGNFVENQLYKTITYDENSPGGTSKIGRTEEYKDKDGKIILKRTFADIFINGVAVESEAKHETYYVYDSFGNLTYVIPPLVTSATSQLDGLCYQYKYDYLNRLVEKKLPGKQWEYIVYDKLDRVVATGPAYNPYGGSDTSKGWLLTKYDLFNRPVYTAWHNAGVASSANRKTLQDTYNNATVFSENKTTSTTTINGIATKYTNQVSPITFILLTVNYYDNYDYPNAPSIPAQIEGQNTQSTNLKGLATGSWVRVLDNASATTNETSYIVYDTRYRPIRSYTKNYLGGYTQVDTKLDWPGKTLYTITSHKRTVSGQLFTVKERFTYTQQDRLLKHTHEIVGALPEQLLTLNTYDELGQLLAKNVGGTDVTGTQAIQKVNYKYNIRGWLTAINDVNNLMPSATENDLFAFKINYNKKENDTEGLYNGNITETLWRTSADNTKRKYAYNYDGLNRLLEANYSKPEDQNTLNNYLEKLSYDKAGNILTLERNGNLDPSGGAPVNQIDNLEYSYHPENKNQLLKVNDLSNSPQGFKDNYTSTENDFSYDNNGNMTVDNNKDIERIIYNHLNLPIKINFGAKGNIYYLYNAIGGKVKKVVEDNVAHITTTTDYLSGFQYKNAELQFFPHAEGYVHYTKPLQMDELGAFNYVFNYTDHLGNVRLSYARDPLVRNRVKILEENHYYAFGLKHKNYNVEHLDFDQFPDTGVELVPMPAVANASYNYKYNGKELQEELGLNMTAMDFRQYDSAIGRFVVMDPLSDLAPMHNPYRYGFNNPVYWKDPSGLIEFEYDKKGKAVGFSTSNQKEISAILDFFKQNEGANATDLHTFVFNDMQSENPTFSFDIQEVVIKGEAKKKVNTLENTKFFNDRIGDGADILGLARNKGGSFRLTNNGSYNPGNISLKYYGSNWTGGSRAGIKTFNISKVIKKGSIVTTVVLGVIEIGEGVNKDMNNYERTGFTNGKNSVKSTAQVSAGIAASIYTGAAIGTAIGGPLGTVVGIVGGAAAGWLASETAGYGVEKTYELIED
jgi:RHS repeat-associated protein